MQKQATLLIGQILQYRDKLYAKRHSVPKDRQETWQQLMVETEQLLPKVNQRTHKKTLSFKGSLSELKSLVNALNNLNSTLAH